MPEGEAGICLLYTSQVVEQVDLNAGGVAFYDGASAADPAELECSQWITSILNDTNPLVLPEQALVVTEILEAIYTSSKTGKAVYFDLSLIHIWARP